MIVNNEFCQLTKYFRAIFTDGRDMASKGQVYVGQVFETRDAFKLHMSMYAIANKFNYLVKRSEPGKMVLECGGANCGWRAYAVKIGGTTRFEIRTADTAHTCSVNERWGFRHHATASIVGDMMRQRYGGPGGVVPRPVSVREIMRNDHSVPISYWKAWRSREIAVSRGDGNVETAYLALPSYLAKLAEANPGSIMAIESTEAAEGAHRFKYLFLAFGASIRGFAYMRKVVIIDGTHLKGKYQGCLLTASA